MDDLRRALAAVLKAGYDYSAAAALKQDVERKRETLQRESQARTAKQEAELARRKADEQPDGIRMLRELEAKRLPQGAAANLAIMRVIVGLAEEDGSST